MIGVKAWYRVGLQGHPARHCPLLLVLGMWGHQDHSEGRALPSVSIFRGQEAEGLTAVRLYLGYTVQPYTIL